MGHGYGDAGCGCPRLMLGLILHSSSTLFTEAVSPTAFVDPAILTRQLSLGIPCLQQPGLELQVGYNTPPASMWVLGSEFWSLCLYGIEPSPQLTPEFSQSSCLPWDYMHAPLQVANTIGVKLNPPCMVGKHSTNRATLQAHKVVPHSKSHSNIS